jgi:hypothetical protein
MDGMLAGLAIGLGCGIAMGMGSGMAIVFGGSGGGGRSSLRKKNGTLLSEGSIRVRDHRGKPITADKLADLLSKKKSS